MSNGATRRMERTRRTITEAATGLFLKNGFLATSMDDIAALAGVSKQTVYAHFGSKEALFLDIVLRLTGGAGDDLQEQVADPTGDRPIGDFLHEFASRQLAIVMTPPLMQLRRLVIAEAERFPELGKALQRNGPGRSIGRLAAAFGRYRESGEVAMTDVAAAASFFNWLVMGEPVNTVMLLGEGAIPPPDALGRHVEESVRIFLAAYGTGTRA